MDERVRAFRRATWINLLGNTLKIVVEGGVGIVFGSTALISNAGHSVADLAASIVVHIWGPTAFEPADSTHVVMQLDSLSDALERLRRLANDRESLQHERLVDVFEFGYHTQREVDILGLVFQPLNRHCRPTEEIHGYRFRQPVVKFLKKLFDRVAACDILPTLPLA